MYELYTQPKVIGVLDWELGTSMYLLYSLGTLQLGNQVSDLCNLSTYSTYSSWDAAAEMSWSIISYIADEEGNNEYGELERRGGDEREMNTVRGK